MMKWVARYTGPLRGLRIFYWLYNISKWQHLNRNKKLYKQLGVKKPVWQNIAHADFKNTDTENIPWMDKPEITEATIRQHSQFASFSAVIQQQLLQWPQNGYMIIPGLLLQEAIAINKEIEELQQEGKVQFNFTGRKIMDAWQHSPAIRQAFHHPTILAILQFVFGKEPLPFQTINFVYGSEQKPHSDSIHMTTEPLGYLSAFWLALEDIQPGSGELVYYPGSHKLPYVMSEHYDTGNTAVAIGENNYKRYENKIDEVIRQHRFQPQTFLAKIGDVLIWHANLLHGGSTITDAAKTRRSMVAHFYADGVLCYHEISQRPAIVKK